MGCMVTGARAGFVPTGMKKNASTFPAPSSWGDITGWIADATYPGSTVTAAHELVAGGTKAGATISASVPFSGGGYFSGVGTQVRILQNGVVIATGAGIASGSGTAVCSTTANVATGDLIKVQIQATLYSGQPSVTANTPALSIT